MYFNLSVEQLLSDSSNSLHNSLVISLGEMARHSALPLKPGAEDDPTTKVTSLSLVKTLVKIFNNKKLPSKVQYRKPDP